MKKIVTQIIILSVCFTFKINAQWYGQLSYPHDSIILSSAKKTNSLPGHIMAGFRKLRPTTPNNLPDFAVDKLDPAGPSSAVNNISWEYQIIDNCASNPGFQYNCSGITIIETLTSQGGARYALVGVHNEGVFFATLDPMGNVLNQRSWNFGFTASYPFKPSIRESRTQPGLFYICASPAGQSHVMKVNSFGAQLWGETINTVSGVPIEARDLIESPYSTNELIVVGRSDVFFPNPYAADAFFLRLNRFNGAYIGSTTYNLFQGGFDSDDWFSSIEIARSPNGGPGFVLGGRALEQDITYSNISFTQWMCKVPPTGGPVIWSSLVQPASAVAGQMSGPEVNRVYERFNSNNGTYEYYGVAGSNAWPTSGGAGIDNLVVYKLDDNGTTGALTPTEFHYRSADCPEGIITAYGDITGIETGGGPDDGFQAFGTDMLQRGDFMVKAYFNGESGCKQQLVDIANIAAGPNDANQPLQLMITNFNQCNGVNIVQINPTQPANIYCAAASISTGSNARTTNVIQAAAAEDYNAQLYPNPFNDELTITANEETKVEVYNALGQLMIKAAVKGTGTINTEELAKGVYYISIKGNSGSRTLKMIKE